MFTIKQLNSNWVNYTKYIKSSADKLSALTVLIILNWRLKELTKYKYNYSKFKLSNVECN